MTKERLRMIECALYCEFSKCKTMIGCDKNFNGEKFAQLFYHVEDVLSYYRADALKDEELLQLEKFLSGEYARVLDKVVKVQKVYDYD